ncbi:MAG: class I SAM-dependent methyltransferase [Gaiella sp.]
MVTSPETRMVFGVDPAAYLRGRPPYPPDVIQRVVERCGLGPGTATLEIGPGAGQATAELLDHGAAPYLAVEPDPSFAAFLEHRFGSRIGVLNEPFESALVDTAAFDLAIAATAWHWVDQNCGLPKLARSLRSGGWWAVWWTEHGEPDRKDELHAALTPILGEDGPSPQALFCFDREARRRDLQATGAFGQVEVDEWRWPLELDPERARALFATFSPILAQPPAERERTLDAIAGTVARDFGGICVRTCTTILYTAQRR